MPIYKIQGPDGNTIKIEGPEGATDAQLIEVAKQHYSSNKTKTAPISRPMHAPQEPNNPTNDMSGTEKFLAGAGKAFYDVGRGVGTLVTDAIPGAEKYGFSTRKDVDEAKKIDEPLMKSGSGIAGNLVGNIAAFAPSALIPGANTILGGTALGGLFGAMQPVGEKESRLNNVLTNGIAGLAVPTGIALAKGTKAAVIDPFTTAGRDRIAGSVLNRSTANPAKVAEALRNAKGATPGFNPTVGQSAGDDGVASLERAVRATDPAGFSEVNKSQIGALADALRGVAQTPEAKTAAIAARESAVKPIYDTAKQASVTGDSVFDALLKRPSMSAAKSRAGNIAAERGEQFALSQATPKQSVATGIVDAQGNSVMREIPEQAATYPGQSLHDLKMGLDDAIGSPGLGGMQGAERNAALGTKEQYLNWLEGKIPEYGQAKKTYAEMSQPINQMDIGQELYNRFIPALSDQGGVPFRSTAQAYANALRHGDDVARNVTGMNGVTMKGIMSPEQMTTLNGVASDAAMKAAADTAGRGAGSDSIQKIAMSNIAAQAGVPNWLASVSRVPAGWMKRAGDVLYGNADEQITSRLAEILRNPPEAAQAMQAAGAIPSQIADYLKKGTQGLGMSLIPTFNANQ